MAGDVNRLKALKAKLLALGVSGALERRQVEAVVKAFDCLWRSINSGDRREAMKAINSLAREFLNATGD